jgi:prepilin-type N-terminal cleavage/methylation domain-containing protein
MAQLSRASSRGAPRNGGFTLLELVLVLVVLAILVSLTVPAFRVLGREQLARECVDNLLACARYARAQSAAEGTTYRLNINPSTGMYWLTRQEGPQFVMLGTEMGEPFEVPPGIRLVYLEPEISPAEADAAEATGRIDPARLPSEVPFIDFRPTGRSDPAELQVIDRDGRVTRLVIPSASETMRVIDGTTGQMRE